MRMLLGWSEWPSSVPGVTFACPGAGGSARTRHEHANVTRVSGVAPIWPLRVTFACSTRPTQSPEHPAQRARRRRWVAISCSWRLQQRLLVGGGGLGPGALGVELPAGGVLGEGEVEDAGDLLDLGRRGQLDQDLDAAVEVAVHQVGGADPRDRLAAVLEVHDPAVLEVAAEDRAHADGLRQPGYAGPDGADAADQQLDGYAGPRRRVERVDERLVDDRVGLDPDARGATFAVVGDLGA